MSLDTDDWKVDIRELGRYGNVDYREGARTIRLFWEFGGGATIAIISGPLPGEWEHSYPWAQGRLYEILCRVAGEVVRLRAPGSRFEIEERRTTILVLPA